MLINGRLLPDHLRVKIIELATQGVRPCAISRQVQKQSSNFKLIVRFDF